MPIETEGVRLLRLINRLEPATRRRLDAEMAAWMRLSLLTSYRYFWVAVLQSFCLAVLLLCMGWNSTPLNIPMVWAGVAIAIAGVLQLTGRGALDSEYLQNEFRAALTRAGICAACAYAYREVKDTTIDRCPECGIAIGAVGQLK